MSECEPGPAPARTPRRGGYAAVAEVSRRGQYVPGATSDAGAISGFSGSRLIDLPTPVLPIRPVALGTP